MHGPGDDRSRKSGVTNGFRNGAKIANLGKVAKHDDEETMTMHVPDRALSVRQLARRWGIAPKKVREMIRRGTLSAIDVGFGRRQVRIMPEAIAECERRLTVQPARRRQAKRYADIDPEVARMISEL